MPLPAGTGLTRRDVRLPHAPGSRSPSTAAARCSSSRSTTGSPARPPTPTGPPERARLGLPRRRHRRDVRALPGRRPALLPAAPEPRACRRPPGIPYTGDSRLRWNPAATSIATLYGEGKVSSIPAIGYADSDLSHFTSRHYWEVGATDAALRTGWLGRYLDLGRHARQPAAGADARRRPPAGARDREGAGGDAPGAPTSTPSPTRASRRTRSSPRCSRRRRTSVRVHASSTDTRPRRRPARPRVSSHHLSTELGAFTYGYSTPGPLPGLDRSRSRTGSPGSRR